MQTELYVEHYFTQSVIVTLSTEKDCLNGEVIVNISNVASWTVSMAWWLTCFFKAACKAIEQAKAQNIKKLVLYTDSMFTINGKLLRFYF